MKVSNAFEEGGSLAEWLACRPRNWAVMNGFESRFDHYLSSNPQPCFLITNWFVSGLLEFLTMLYSV